MLSRRRSEKGMTRLAATGFAGVAAITLLAACSSGGGSSSSSTTPTTSASSSATSSSSASASASASPSGTPILAGANCSSSATHITFWAWVPGMSRAVTEFNATHPNICVTLQDPGAGPGEYVPLDNALKAGTGAPDVAEVEFDLLPSYEIQHYLVNLVPYGANNYKSDFATWAWSQVSQGSAVYAMPSDFGPMGFYYDQATLAQYHITPPTTWSQFATDAIALHKANPKAYLINFPANDPQWLMDMMAQAGAWPFQYTGGANLTINWTGSAQEKFASFWQTLISDHAVAAITDLSTEMNTDLDTGVLGGAIYSAWAPSYFAPDVKHSMGQWRAAPLPQWTAGASVGSDWGGSTYPVFSESKHPQQAAEFSEWLTATDQSWNIVKTPPSSLFPTYLPTLQSASFKSLAYPISGTSQPNQVFSAGALSIPLTTWPPFMTQVLTQGASTFGGVVTGKETLSQAFATFQQQEVSYAKSQGFNVTT
jgi:multiple sugar transport system substrate-binding protein